MAYKDPYTREQIEYLKEITPGRFNKEITKMFNDKFNDNRTEGAIHGVRLRNGIKTGISGRYPKGSTPWNMGKAGYMGANRTSFKKGSFSNNRVPLGSERITKDGYIQIKIKDGELQQNWRGKHLLIWEKENGPLPKGYAIIFGDQDKRNFDIDNLICVSRKQLVRMNQNGLIKNDADLTRVGITIADLISKTNEVGR